MKFVEENGEITFKTTLIEVNDGFALGVYDGISDKDYTDMLIARWEHLMNSKGLKDSKGQ
jgi:hypothetical protein